MKVLICGSKDIWAIENHYCQFLNHLDVQTTIFPIGNLFRESYHTLFQKLLHKTNPAFLLNRINQMLLNTIEELKPDAVWVFKGMEVYPNTLKSIQQQGIFLLNYNPDHPFLFSSRGSGNKLVVQAVPRYNLHLSYNRSIVQRIKKEYNINCEFLPFGYNHNGLEYGFSPKEEVLRTAFIGNPDEIRKQTIVNLLNSGFEVDVYGNGWNRYLKGFTNLQIFPAIYGRELCETFQKYRVQLNIFRPHNINSHNMRTFEIPSVGGIMLAPESDEHRLFFEQDKEAVYYTDFADLNRKISELLILSSDDSRIIREAAYQRSKRSKYSYFNRAEQVKAILEKYM